ncbi:hypothetical protein [uncultured Flavobacterium sp.]|uniref:hypothetical protein n=1 Tax=uncultured Flavobacterium sp. TaxID=165435 RepID=UPI0025FC510D|nr:hypothetical protein [uncultured Flavobacterium sp.]
MTLLKKIKGKSLFDLTQNGYFDMIYPDYVSESVNAGLKKIEIFFGAIPNIYGSNIEAFKEIRDSLFFLSNGCNIINSFNIAVPHTHWEGQNPVIYKFQEKSNRYIIGHHEPDLNKIYFPVSFVFSEKEVLPYEWLEYDSKISEKEFYQTYNLLIELHKKIAPNKWPLGINIDFRFKDALHQESIPTVEVPLNEDNLEDFAFVQKYSEYVQTDGPEHTEQVAWPAVSEMSYDLKPNELNLLRKLRSKMSKLSSDSERELFLNRFLG